MSVLAVDLSSEMGVRMVVRDILTSRDDERPKFNYNSVKTVMLKKYGSAAFERVKPVVGMFCAQFFFCKRERQMER